MLTLTEALQETKTLKERIQKKRERVTQFLCRTALMRDRMEEEGGEEEHVRRELQAISDMEERLLDVKHSIIVANSTTVVTVEGVTRTIEDWIHWKREVAPLRKSFIERVLKHVEELRQRFDQDRRSHSSNESIDPKSFNLVVNADERVLQKELEQLELILSSLDAKLSVKNAGTLVEGL